MGSRTRSGLALIMVSAVFACNSNESGGDGNGGSSGASATGGSISASGGASAGGKSGGTANAAGGTRASGGTTVGGSAPGGAPAPGGTGGSKASSGSSAAGGGDATGGALARGGMGTAMPSDTAIIFLHHSTGQVIWDGGVSAWFDDYNAQQGKSYGITPQEFPKDSPYGWNNYPYDYWNIWVNNAGPGPYLEEPTLEILTQQYQVIVWKHCFPSSNVLPDTGTPDITSSVKTAENYKLQYAALRDKMHQFPAKRFVVWTGAALREEETDVDEATRARTFFQWVKQAWDVPGDNVFIFDFRELETGRGLYLLPDNAASDSHPNATFAERVAPLFAKRVTDVIEGRGDTGSLTGE